MKRKRINTVAIASSENYQRSRELHYSHVVRKHFENKEEIKKLEYKNSTRVIRVFGREVIVTEEELNIHYTLKNYEKD